MNYQMALRDHKEDVLAAFIEIGPELPLRHETSKFAVRPNQAM
jgi:hypothetical protein